MYCPSIYYGVGGTPIYVDSGKEALIHTADGRTLVDFCCSWGAMIVGHAQKEIVETLQKRAAMGTTFGINTPDEVLLAERLCSLVPGLDRVRLVNSGTEAVMTALRIARGVTGRKRVIKFDGCYHGHTDSMLVSAGSGLLTGGTLNSLGVSRHVANDTYVAPYNDVGAVNQLVREKGQEIAAIIVEPVAGNMGLVLPEPHFLEKLRHMADRCGALLILDEVIDGFRFHLSTYAKMIGVKPDLTTLGKVIGGGLPMAAIGGAATFMDRLSPMGKIYQAGTLSGNPLAVAAGLKTLEILERDNPYPRMEKLTTQMAAAINAAAKKYNVPLLCQHFKGVFTIFATSDPIHNLADAKKSDTALYAKVFHAMLARGFYIEPSQFEVNFVSAAHTEEQVMAFANAMEEEMKTGAWSKVDKGTDLLSPGTLEGKPGGRTGRTDQATI